MKESIHSFEDVMAMLDVLLKEQSHFQWDEFYSNREKPIPFFANVPDESLVEYVERHLPNSGKALDLGCGPGRNAIYLAKQGWDVDAVDLSQEAIRWAEERASEAGVQVNFIRRFRLVRLGGVPAKVHKGRVRLHRRKIGRHLPRI